MAMTTVQNWVKTHLPTQSILSGPTHPARVIHLALIIGQSLSANLEVIEIAATLRVVYSDPWDASHARVMEFVETLSLAPQSREKIDATLRQLKSQCFDSLEAMAIHDAYYLDKLGHIGIARYFAMIGGQTGGWEFKETNPDAELRKLINSAHKNWQRLLTNLGQSLGQARYQKLKEFVTLLDEEVNLRF